MSFPVGTTVDLHPRNRTKQAILGTVVGISANVSQLPQRFWSGPNRPAWGKQIFILPDPSHNLTPGETFDIATRRDTDALRASAASVSVESPLPFSIKDPVPLNVPKELLQKSRFEPSGILWLNPLQRYVAVSDDTGIHNLNSGIPWVFTFDGKGTIDPQPIAIEGIRRISDLEGITASPDGRIYLIASQSENRKGVRRSERTLFISAHLQGQKLLSDSHVFLYDLLMDAQRDNPAFFASLGFPATRDPASFPIDIEGLAWHNGALYLGLRHPLDASGRALIWKLANPDSLFQRKSLSKAALSLWKKVPLQAAGAAAGISDILFLPDNSLLLSCTSPQGGAIVHAVETDKYDLGITPIGSYPGLKPEGLCIAPDGRVAVVFDQQEKQPLWMHLEIHR
jgi:hypothetical protein